MTKKMMGHNMPPKVIDDFYILDADGESTGRIKLTNTIINKHLVRRYDKEKDKYRERILNDSEKIGLKAKVGPTTDGTKSFFYQYTPKGDRIPKKYHLGHFPEMKIDAARSLVEDLKQAIKLGRDPKTVIEERRNAKTLFEVAELWTNTVLDKSARFKQSSIHNIKSRLKVWLRLESVHPKTNRIILNNRSDLNIGNKKMVEITKDDLVAYHAAISKAGRYQANRVIEDLRIIFKWAKGKYIKENVCVFTEEDWNKEYKRMDDKKPYSKHEWRLLRVAAHKLAKKNPRVFVACMGILLTLYKGRRYKNELLSLKWTQVDWDLNKVLLPETKTGKSSFSIDRLTRSIFRKMWAYKKERFKNIKSIKSRYVFPSTRKAKRPYIQDVRKTWNKICTAAKVRRLEIYMLRHTWGCLSLVALNGNLKALKDEGGWKTDEMVETYAEFNEQQLKKYSEDIAQYLSHAK
jgi:integrase